MRKLCCRSEMMANQRIEQVFFVDDDSVLREHNRIVRVKVMKCIRKRTSKEPGQLLIARVELSRLEKMPVHRQRTKDDCRRAVSDTDTTDTTTPRIDAIRFSINSDQTLTAQIQCCQ